MKFILEEEIEEIPPVKESYDNALVISRSNPLPTEAPRAIDELTKEISAIDGINLGNNKKAAEINSVDRSSVDDFVKGERMNEDTRARVLSYKHNIQDTTVTKLMDTLKLLEPEHIVKTRDKLYTIDTLSKVLDRFSGNQDSRKGMVLHLHMPSQKKEEDYKVIDA